MSLYCLCDEALCEKGHLFAKLYPLLLCLFGIFSLTVRISLLLRFIAVVVKKEWEVFSVILFCMYVLYLEKIALSNMFFGLVNLPCYMLTQIT